ncbi:MAG TPA: PaaI family thioesterase [Solirubrobacteraceae bacterium]|nr:PaaI family thioesterase [Solirubrobacteraceae bacterium]
MGLTPSTDATGFDALYGLELTEVGEQLARGRVRVRDQLRQPAGSVHGGVYAAVADALAVRGTVAGSLDQRAVGLTTHTSVLHPIDDGAMHATAVRRHRGRTTWVWEVEIADDAGRVCVVARVTVAVPG